MDVVSGAFSYTGRAIAEELLRRGRAVRTLTRRTHPDDPLAARIEWRRSSSAIPCCSRARRRSTTPTGSARDVLLTPDELRGLMASLLVSHAPPLANESFRAWLESHGQELGRTYVSELARNFRPYR